MARSRNKRKRTAKSAATKPPPPPDSPETNWHRAGRLVSTLSGGGVVVLVLESAAVAGVVDVTLAYLMLVAAWVVGLATIVLAVRSWPVPKHHRLLSGAISGAVLTVLLLGVGWYEKTHQSSTDAGARIQVMGHDLHRPRAGEKLFLNTYFKNQGALAATEYRTAFFFGYEDHTLSTVALDNIIAGMHNKLEIRQKSEGEFQPGEEWFVSFPPPNFDESPDIDQWREIVSLRKYLYIIIVLEYSDRNLSSGAKRYTESCVFIWGDAIHICGSHNRVYVSS